MRMLRLFFLCRYFNKFHGLRGGTWEYYQDTVDRNQFIGYVLIIKHFGEDYRETFNRYIHYFTKTPISEHNKKLYRAQKVRRMVNDLVEDAKRRNYLIEGGTNYNITLQMDDRGRAFIKPFKFIQTCAKEYGYFASIVAAFILGIGGTLLFVFWAKIIDFMV